MIRYRCLAVLMVCLTLVLASCHGQRPDEPPVADRTDDGIYQMASRVSEQADAVVVIRNIEGFLGHLEGQRAFELLGIDAPPEAVGRILAGSMGFDPRDVRAWRSKGIRTDAPLMLVFFQDDPVLLLPIADADQFNGYMESQPWSHDSRRSRARNRPGRGQVRRDALEGTEQGPPIWDVGNGVACISLHKRRRDLERACVQPGALSSSPLSGTAAFLTFRDGPMREADIGFFAPSYNFATVEGFVHAFSRHELFAVDVVMRAIGETDGLSMTGTVDGDVLEANAQLRLTERGHDALAELFDVSSVVDTAGVLPPDTVAALRFAVEPDTAWSWARSVLHWEARRDLHREMTELGEMLGREFDLEAEVIEQLAGEVVMVVQPLPPKPKAQQRQPARWPQHNHHRYALTEDGMGFSFIIPFEDPVAPPKLLDLLEDIDTATSSKSGQKPRVVVRDGRKGTGIQVAEFSDKYMPRIMVRGKQLLVAPSLLPVEEAEKMLLSAHPEVDSTGARRFVDASGAASGFFDFQAFFDAVGRAKAEEELGDLARQMQFAQAYVHLEPDALVADGRMVDLSFVRIIVSEILGHEVRQFESRPRHRLHSLARMAARYYSGYQRGCSSVAQCREPWHAGATSTISRDERVFPGGVGQRLVTHTAAPVAAKSVDIELDARRFADKTAQLLGFGSRSASRFQYIYETNDKTGPGAKFTLKAVADLDPTTPEKHTFILTGEVGSSGQVDISQIEERHRFQ